MSNGRVNILLGMSLEDGFITKLSEVFQKEGIEVGRAETRYGKRALQQYLEVHEDVDIIIVACGQENGDFEPMELDLLSQYVPERNFVVILYDELEGTDYVVRLAACGIYTGVFEKDASIDYVVKLIKNGRTKLEAREYYGIKNEDILSNSAESFDANRSIAFLHTYDGTIEDLYDKMKKIESKLQATELMTLISELPEELLSMVARIPDYATMCNMVMEQRRKETIALPKTKRELPGTAKGRNEAKITPKEMLGLAEERQITEIGFTAFNTGAGCTFQAIMMAHALADSFRDKKVALVEFDSDDASFYSLCKLATGNQNISGLNTFQIKKVTYFFNTPYNQFIYAHRKNFDFIIYDFGCCNNDTIAGSVLPLNRAFVVVNTNEWRYGELAEFHREISRFDTECKLEYLMPATDETTVYDAMKIVHGHRAFYIGYEKNPYVPSAKSKKHMVALALGKANTEKAKASGGFRKRIKGGGKTVRISTVLYLLSVCIFFCVAFLVYTQGNAKYNDLYMQAKNALQQKELEIDTLKEVVINLEEEQHAKERVVLFLTRNVKAGEVITEDMVEERTVSMDVPQEQYFQMAYIGYYVLACDMYTGEPIHVSNVKRYEPQTEEISDMVMEESIE